MANEQNLIPNYERTPSERQEIARKGGIASGKARQERATMKKVLEDMLKETNNSGLTYQQLATLGLIKGATKGNAQNYKTIIEMLGEVPKEQFNDTKDPVININMINNEDLQKDFFDKEEK